MSVAVQRIVDVLDAIASTQDGGTASEIASWLNAGRQATVRLLDSMVKEGIAVKDEATKRYRLSLKAYGWGSRAVGPYLPPFYLRQEIANLVRDVRHPIFYFILDGAEVVTLERSDCLGDVAITVPNAGAAGRGHWSQSARGKVLVAFSPPEERDRLVAIEHQNDGASFELEAELETIRRQGFAERLLAADRMTMAVPILRRDGYAEGGLTMGINNYSPAERLELLRKLTDVSIRASYDSGYSPILIEH